MEEMMVDYKHDPYGNPIQARVFYPEQKPSVALSIALVFHLGGFVTGSAATVPRSQIRLLVDASFAVMVPDYRLAPKVPASQAFRDSEDAFEFAVSTLPAIVRHRSGTLLDSSTVVAMGYSSGGTLALHLASCRPLKAVTAFYPSLFLSDPSTSAHRPMVGSPMTVPSAFGANGDWASFRPGAELSSEADERLDPRTTWLTELMKTGRWLPEIQPDRDFAAIDPMTRLHAHWPPVMLLQGTHDIVPGSSLELARRAQGKMKDAGVEEVALELVAGEAHAFDLSLYGPQAGDARWEAIVRGIDWLIQHRGPLKVLSPRRLHVPQLDVHISYV